MINLKFAKRSLNPSNIFDLMDYKKEYKKNHPDEFPFHGFLCFSGEQGSGKSLTAFRFIDAIKDVYPDCVIVSNVNIPHFDYIPYKGLDTLLNCDNGEKGIIFFCDEISNEFCNLSDISPEWFTIINMQRKRHLLIIGTCPQV